MELLARAKVANMKIIFFFPISINFIHLVRVWPSGIVSVLYVCFIDNKNIFSPSRFVVNKQNGRLMEMYMNFNGKKKTDKRNLFPHLEVVK